MQADCHVMQIHSVVEQDTPFCVSALLQCVNCNDSIMYAACPVLQLGLAVKQALLCASLCLMSCKHTQHLM
jgi:hypothetical protein